MISIFNSKNSEAYRATISLLMDHGIEHYTKEDYQSSVQYTSYKIFIEEKDLEKSREILEILKSGREEKIYYYEDFDLTSIAISFIIIAVVVISFWITSINPN